MYNVYRDKTKENEMKTINCFGMKMELTQERKNRITSALIETMSKLDKELAYSEDLRKQGQIDFYIAHIEKLENILS